MEIEHDWVMAMAKVMDEGYPTLEHVHGSSVGVELTEIESLTAGMTGLCRQMSSVYAGRKPRYPGKPGDMVRNHVMGAIAEAAFAKWLDVWFGGTIDTFHVADVAGVEVRWSSKGDGVSVRKDDGKSPGKPNHNIRVVGLTGEPPRMTILGWVWSDDAKVDDWWTSWSHSYRVPLTEVNSMTSWKKST